MPGPAAGGIREYRDVGNERARGELVVIEADNGRGLTKV
jgi:hypothetical protein